MNTQDMTLKELLAIARQFLTERNWQQFHNPKTDAANIVCEASELLELFLWSGTPEESYAQLEKVRTAATEEVGDIFLAFLLFCDTAGIDVQKAFLDKLEKTKIKYPVSTASGTGYNSIKYGDKNN
ncbi:nucleotide pyrophosphohydrolase [bacterium]|nr:nucleotide pyrophosphohydrolase [bacterium]